MVLLEGFIKCPYTVQYVGGVPGPQVFPHRKMLLAKKSLNAVICVGCVHETPILLSER